jgi:ABC-2 type transport system permease protein
MAPVRYLRVYTALLKNSLIREMSFKVNFLLWTLVEVLWFLGQILFIEVLFSHVDSIGDWNKWQMVALVGTHQTIAQIFQAFFYVNLVNLPELVRTGKLDSYLTLPVDSQFAVSMRQFGFDNLFNALIGLAMVSYALYRLQVTPTSVQILLFSAGVCFGIAIHYSVLFCLSTLCFWIIRAQGMVYAYFNLFNIGRYPESTFQGPFRAVFSWVIPVILVANVPARILTRSQESPWQALGQMLLATLLVLSLTRMLWQRGLKRYSSASS